MERQYVKENNESRERLRRLVNDITDTELKYVIYNEGWTIAVALGHLAFWDQRRAIQIQKWKKDGITESGLNDFDTHVINDTLLPFLHSLPPRKAAKLAVSSAGIIDATLEELTPELVTKIETMGDEYALHRAPHRKMHLDEIDVLLKAKRSGENK